MENFGGVCLEPGNGSQNEGPSPGGNQLLGVCVWDPFVTSVRPLPTIVHLSSLDSLLGGKAEREREEDEKLRMLVVLPVCYLSEVPDENSRLESLVASLP